MIAHPWRSPAAATVDDVRAVLADDHVHLVLLTQGSRLVGTVERTDLPPTALGSLPALPFSRLRERTVDPHTSAEVVRADLLRRGSRRMAVVDAHGRLLGLLCLKRSGEGFCSDAGVLARRHGVLA